MSRSIADAAPTGAGDGRSTARAARRSPPPFDSLGSSSVCRSMASRLARQRRLAPPPKRPTRCKALPAATSRRPTRGMVARAATRRCPTRCKVVRAASPTCPTGCKVVRAASPTCSSRCKKELKGESDVSNSPFGLSCSQSDISNSLRGRPCSDSDVSKPGGNGSVRLFDDSACFQAGFPG